LGFCLFEVIYWGKFEGKMRGWKRKTTMYGKVSKYEEREFAHFHSFIAHCQSKEGKCLVRILKYSWKIVVKLSEWKLLSELSLFENGNLTDFCFVELIRR
jgi:hypothetical protein